MTTGVCSFFCWIICSCRACLEVSLCQTAQLRVS